MQGLGYLLAHDDTPPHSSALGATTIAGVRRDTVWPTSATCLAESQSVHCKPILLMKRGFSLRTFSHREIQLFPSPGKPCNENRIFPVWEKYTGKTLFWPCTGPVRDCSVAIFQKVLMYLSLPQMYELYKFS